MTDRLHRDDPYRLDFEARVVDRREHDGRTAVVLDRSAFYAESGGQPWDTGTLAEATVVAVIEDRGEVLHVLDGPVPEGRVQGRVDGQRRRDHRQQHHGQHLLSQAFVQAVDARTIGFHLGADVTTIDLDRPVGDDQIRAAETRANEIVWEARPVRVRTVSAREARALGVVPPEGVEDEVRLVEAEGFDLQPCGGTHPRSTAEVGVVVVTTAERYKGGTRVGFVCGHRALATIAARGRTLDRLVDTLSAPVDELADVARKLKDDLAEGARRERGLLERALEGDARRLLDEAQGGVVATAFDGWPPGDLRLLAQRLVALAPCVALLGSRSDKAHLVFAQSEGMPHDVPGLLRSAVGRLGGRGGGRGNMAQGGGDRSDLLEEVLQDAATRVRSGA